MKARTKRLGKNNWEKGNLSMEFTTLKKYKLVTVGGYVSYYLKII